MVEPRKLIDFTTADATADFRALKRLSHGGVHLAQVEFLPNPGLLTSATRLVIGMHESEPMEFHWRLPSDRETRRVMMQPGGIYINPPHRYLYQEWPARPRVMIMALDADVLEPVGQSLGGRRAEDLATVVGLRDPDIETAFRLLSREMAEPDGPVRLLAEGVAVSMAVHLFRTYTNNAAINPPRTGALGTARLRRVIDHIERHLGDHITLPDLSRVAGLSARHFGGAFKAAVGLSPYRYVIKRRVLLGGDMLQSTDRPITEIAYALGFPSHGHFSTQFQRYMGVSPSRYRNDRK